MLQTERQTEGWMKSIPIISSPLHGGDYRWHLCSNIYMATRDQWMSNKSCNVISYDWIEHCLL